MRTVGVICEHYSFLDQFKDFLEEFIVYVERKEWEIKNESI